MAKENDVSTEQEQEQTAAEQEQTAQDEKNEEANAEPEKKYTDSDVDEIVKRRLAREKADWESKLAKERKEASEAEKLKGMNDLERATHENKRLATENAELQRQLNLQEQMEVARESLADAGIHFSHDLLAMFVSDDAEKTKKSVDSVKTLWVSEVDKAVKDALKSATPKATNPTGSSKASVGKTFAENYNKKMNGGK